MKPKLVFLLLITFLIFTPVIAQYEDIYEDNVLSYDTSGLTFFVPEKLEPGDLFSTYHDVFFQDDQNTAVLMKTWTDDVLQMQHFRYQQHYLEIPVEGAEYLEHASDGWLVFANGKVAYGIEDVVSQSISESVAFEYLMAELAGYRFAWEDELWESQIQQDMEDLDASFLPTGKLIWALNDPSAVRAWMSGENFRLAYTFDVKALEPSLHRRYYVDALTGEMFREVELECSNGPAALMTYGTQTIDTRWAGSLSKHILHANDNGHDIRTRYLTENHLTWGLTPDIKDGDDNWGSDDEKGTTPHWMVSQAWDFFASAPYNRLGMNGSGGQVRVQADWNEARAQYENIAGNNDYVRFGWLDSEYLAVIDVVGHEYGHGIDNYTADLEYESESGALDESFADIYGFLVERYTDGVVNDWTIGEDATAFRSFADPALFDQPTTFLGANWAPTANPSNTNDRGGVHINSGVQNFWFFLLANGGIGTNDNNDNYEVVGIGVDDAALIAYWNHTTILASNSQIIDARAGAIAAAIQNFGFCSLQHRETENAWAAVGVGNPSLCPLTALEDQEIIVPKIIAYPNPVSSELSLSLELKGKYDLTIVNSEGRTVYSESNCLGNTRSISTTDLVDGLYFLSVKNNGKIATTKFVKQN